MACNCIKQVNEQLASANGRLAVGFGITKDLGVIARLLVGVEKVDKAKRAKPPVVSASHCPFCGAKFEGCAMAEPANPSPLPSTPT